MNDAIEVAGYGLILGFLWFVWPPLVLLGAGLLLVTYANTRTGRGRLGAAVGAAWSAARAAYRIQQERVEQRADLRRVS